MAPKPPIRRELKSLYPRAPNFNAPRRSFRAIIRGVILALAIAGLFVLPDPWRVVALAVALLIEVGEVFFWIRFLRRYRVTTGIEGLIGERAEVIEALSPAGRVRIRGEIWNARGRSAVPAGEPVRIAAVEGLTLIVEQDR